MLTINADSFTPVRDAGPRQEYDRIGDGPPMCKTGRPQAVSEIFRLRAVLVLFVMVSFGTAYLGLGSAESVPEVQSTPLEREKPRKLIVVRLGAETISIPAPFDFVEPSNALPELRKEAELFVHPDSEMLAFFIPTDDFKERLGGADNEMRRYVFVTTPIQSKSARITQARFDRAKTEYRKTSTELLEKAKDDVNRIYKDRGKDLTRYPRMFSQLRISGMVGLGVCDETPRSITLGAISRVETKRSNETIAITLVSMQVIALVKGKFITGEIYNSYNSVDDIEWSKELARDWGKGRFRKQLKRAPGSTMPFCPQCRREYREGFTRCSDCALELVTQRPFDQEKIPPKPKGQSTDPMHKIKKGSSLGERVFMAIGATLALALLRGGGAAGSGGGAILAGLNAFIGAIAGKFVYRAIFDRDKTNVRERDEIEDEEAGESRLVRLRRPQRYRAAPVHRCR